MVMHEPYRFLHTGFQSAALNMACFSLAKAVNLAGTLSKCRT